MTTRSRNSSRYLGRVTAAQLDRAGTPHGPQTQSPRADWASCLVNDRHESPVSRDVVDVCELPTVAASEFVAARALIVDNGHAMWHDGVVDIVTRRFAYHTFARNQRVACHTTNYVRCEEVN